MSRDFFEVGVVVVKRRLKGPWASHEWRPIAVLPAAPAIPPGTRLSGADGEETLYIGAAEVELHMRSTGHYRDNLTSRQPSVWVVLRPVGEEVELASATVDPYEGEALAESIGDIVEAVPMPVPVQEKVQAFFDAFHEEQVFIKRKRDRANPEALSWRGRVSGPPGDEE